MKVSLGRHACWFDYYFEDCLCVLLAIAPDFLPFLQGDSGLKDPNCSPYEGVLQVLAGQRRDEAVSPPLFWSWDSV